jgi:hypothetical protein
MAHVDLAANLEAVSETRALMGRRLGLGMAAVGDSGQTVGRRPQLVSPQPKYVLKVGEIQVTSERGGKC